MQNQNFSRRDFLKFCTMALGGMAIPRDLLSIVNQLDGENIGKLLEPSINFQWQNEFLRKVIYPRREAKLREFLINYQDVDIWTEYKRKDISELTDIVDEYKKSWKSITAAALKEYNQLRNYFLKADVRSEFSDFPTLDEEEMTEINGFHNIFVQSWPKDIRGESAFVHSLRIRWKQHCIRIGDRIKSLDRRHDAMDPSHPKYVSEGEELVFKENTTLPMAETELDKIDAFFDTYGKLEERKLAWFKLKKSDPNFNLSEDEFIETFPAEREVTVADIARWLADEYKKSLAGKDQYELLKLIRERFQKEPERFPPWLQYVVVHLSGMRYASAHGSWADPRDLLARLHEPQIEAEVNLMDDAAVEKLCKEKLEAYESTTASARPKLSQANDKKWKDELRWYLTDMKSTGPKTRRNGLTALLKAESSYSFMSKTAEETHNILLSLKDTFHPWIWHEIVRLTDLRVTQAVDQHWEILPPQEVVEELHEPENNHLRKIIKEWEQLHTAAWRDEHGRTLELIITRSVCNETAEHCQHVRGHLPPGGLTPKPKWYHDHEIKGDLPGSYFIKPVSAQDYTPGASILWLRFVNQKPDAWQVAKPIETRQHINLLPPEFVKRKQNDLGVWTYDLGDMITRTRKTIVDKQKLVEVQWLRWIHEATVAEVAETVDGMMVITFETSLPSDSSDTSSVGIHMMPLHWHLSDGSEDQYNRSFVGYVPEGQLPFDKLEKMLDWERIFRE